MNDTCVIDDFGPIPVVRPTDVAELGEIVRAARAALYPLGGRTGLHLGTPPTQPGQAIDLRGLDQVIDFPARDMTITVQAGIPVRKLQEIAAAEHLRLPVDIPNADRATLGGIIATNASGPRRYGDGTLRDYVIGISAVNDEGREFKAGGRVVKNVAGYDLCKLLVGSLGTLGIITQATLKLRPLAEEQALVILPTEAAALEPLLTKLHGSRTRPICLELLNAPAARAVFPNADIPPPPAPWALVVGFEGNRDAVNWQVQQLVKELGAQCKMEARLGFTARPLWHALTEWAAVGGAEAVTFKASVLPSAVADFCLAADRQDNQPGLRAHAGNGIVVGHWATGLAQDGAQAQCGQWRAQAKHVTVVRCPAAWKVALPVWDTPADGWLMRAVKERFDPRRMFNPGRFVDGI